MADPGGTGGDRWQIAPAKSLAEAWSTYHQFENYSFTDSPLPFPEFLSCWERLLADCSAVGCQYSHLAMAFKLIKNSNISEVDGEQLLMAVTRNNNNWNRPQESFYIQIKSALLSHYQTMSTESSYEHESVHSSLDSTVKTEFKEELTVPDTAVMTEVESASPRRVSTKPPSRQPMFCCSECGYKTKRRHDLKLHTADKHASGLAHKCGECDFTTANRHSLRGHRLRHEGRKYLCDQCEYTAGRADHLRHLASVHDGARFPCDQCNYEATDRSALVQHRKSIHDHVRYLCEQCEFQARDPAHLRKHRKTVHEGRVYRCVECDYSCRASYDLKLHTDSVHRGITFPCHLCSHVANFSRSLREHVQSVHEGAKFLCDECEYVATKASNLNKHKKKKHEKRIT